MGCNMLGRPPCHVLLDGGGDKERDDDSALCLGELSRCSGVQLGDRGGGATTQPYALSDAVVYSLATEVGAQHRYACDGGAGGHVREMNSQWRRGLRRRGLGGTVLR